MFRVVHTPAYLFLSFLLAGIALADEPPGLRLGDAVRPTAYEIELRIDPDAETFTGRVQIPVQLAAPTELIWLNARDLDLTSAAVAVGERVIEAQVVDGGDEHVGLRLAEPLPAGEARLRITYSGALRQDEVSGLFRREVADEWYVFSQMEPLDARRVFPGFDEPGFKVPFDVSLTFKPGHRAFFNTPEESRTTGDDGWTTVRFARSKPLPTYLVAFGVGPFDVVDAGTAGQNDTPLRVIVPKGKSTHAEYAVMATPPILELLEEYFGMPYPYEKLDQIAIPNVGFAMEHPGLVTYGQQILLRDPEEDSIPRQRNFADVCAHELAHMWFGDLVTMEWWDDLWLNEAFATWMENKIVHRWQPTWDRDVSAVRGRGWALGSDALTSARQIRQPIESTDDIANAFDGITYGKGAAVLAMFESWVGEKSLRNGVRTYMKRHAHGSATAGDFLAALESAADRDIASAFTTFIDQNGAPEVTAELTCPEEGRPFVQLAQRRYTPADAPPLPPQLWRIPVCVEYGQSTEQHRQCVLMTEERTRLELKTEHCPQWILPNADMAGYYRIKLDVDALDELLADGGSRLSVPEQVGVVGDLSAMILAGSLTKGDALTRLPLLLKMKNRHAISGSAGIVSGVNDLVTDELRLTYARFILETYGEQARQLGWTPAPDDDEDTKLLRPSVVQLVAVFGEDPPLIAEARRLTERWLEDRSAIDPQLVGLVLRVAARNSGESLWKRLYAQAKSHTDERERQHLLGAMAGFRDPKLIAKNFEVVMSGEFEIFEAAGLLLGPLGDPATRELPYSWLKQHYDELIPLLPQQFQGFVPYLASGFCDQERANEVAAFFESRIDDLEGGPRTLAQVLESMRICAVYREAQQPSVTRFLRALLKPAEPVDG